MQAGSHQLTGHVEGLGLRTKHSTLPLVRGEPSSSEELGASLLDPAELRQQLASHARQQV